MSANELLLDSARSGDLAGIVKALADGANPEVEDGRHKRETALMYVAAGGRLDCMAVLLDAKATPDHRNRWGVVALHLAAESGDVAGTALLISHGASPSIQSRWGRTALHMAAAKGHAETCRLLVAAGADLGIEDQRGRSPLDVCRSDQLRGLLVSEAERLALAAGLATPSGKSATHRI